MDEERVQALEDERAIVRTLYLCARALDHGRDSAEFLACFTETALYWSSNDGLKSGPAGVRHLGHADLQRWFGADASTRSQPGHVTKHIVWKPEVVLAGDKANVESYFAVLHATKHGPEVYSLGRCLDSFVRSSNGDWRIQERHVSKESVVGDGQSLADTYD